MVVMSDSTGIAKDTGVWTSKVFVVVKLTIELLQGLETTSGIKAWRLLCENSLMSLEVRRGSYIMPAVE